MIRWTWIIDRGSAVDRESKDWVGIEYDQEELWVHATSSRWLEYLVEGRLVVDGLKPSPNFVFFYLWIIEVHYP